MFVKKFEADTIEEALKAVKLELGPDAIILKTITNNGIKGAFKKKRIEITAAITQQNYEKKAQVDKILSPEQKEAFYQKPAGNVQESINKYVDDNKKPSSYGNLGLNKVVNTLSKGTSSLAEVSTKTSHMIKNSLDDFLNFEDENDSHHQMIDDSHIEPPHVKVKRGGGGKGKYSEPPTVKNIQREENHRTEYQTDNFQDAKFVSIDLYNELKQEFKTQNHKVQLLEKKIQEIYQNMQTQQPVLHESKGLSQLRNTLKTLDISDAIIVELVRKASLELSKDDLENADLIFEFALKELTDSVYTSSSLMASSDINSPVITVLISESSVGQSSISLKLASLRKKAIIVEYLGQEEELSNNSFASKILNIPIEKVKNLSEVISLCRKSIDKKESIVIDLKIQYLKLDEIKKFLEALKRGFQNVEILSCISSIHSEIYNRKIISRYKDFLDGVMISHIDQCLSFGSIINLHRAFDRIPLVYFSTGAIIPDDFEAASAERIMAGLFQF